MVKHINVALSDTEYDRLKERKGDQTWAEFMLEQVNDE